MVEKSVIITGGSSKYIQVRVPDLCSDKLVRNKDRWFEMTVAETYAFTTVTQCHSIGDK